MATEMEFESIEAVERYVVEEAFNEGNLASIDETHTDDYVGHWFLPDGEDADVDALKGFIGDLRAGFPDFEMTIEELVVADDTVTTVFTGRGTHEGEFMGIPATGNENETHGIMVHRYEDDKVVEAWAVWDALGMMQHLGVFPKDVRLTSFLETALNLAKQDVLGRRKGKKGEA